MIMIRTAMFNFGVETASDLMKDLLKFYQNNFNKIIKIIKSQA